MKRRKEDLGTFTMEQLHHVLADMFGAGTDTALTTIKWIVLYMILHPDIQVMNQGFPIDNECIESLLSSVELNVLGTSSS